jgi:hypothetical protein
MRARNTLLNQAVKELRAALETATIRLEERDRIIERLLAERPRKPEPEA